MVDFVSPFVYTSGMAYIQINLRVPKDLLDQFDAYADRMGVTRSWLLRDLMGVSDPRLAEPARPAPSKREPDEMVTPVRKALVGRAQAVPPEKVETVAPECDHPKGMRRVLAYGTWCSMCSKKLS